MGHLRCCAACSSPPHLGFHAACEPAHCCLRESLPLQVAPWHEADRDMHELTQLHVHPLNMTVHCARQTHQRYLCDQGSQLLHLLQLRGRATVTALP